MLVWMWLCAANAQDAALDELLGPAPETPASAASVPLAPQAPAIPWWLGLGAVGLVIAWWSRGKLGLQQLQQPAQLRVVGRTALGGRAGLTVVEVRIAEGGWRRLVVGTGDGAPSLVADLGITSFDEALQIAELPQVAPAPMSSPVSAPVAVPRRPGAQRAPPAIELPRAPGATSSTDTLVSEVLGERRNTRSTVSTLA